jgi:glycosyltransferase involved in cell wall biosynthesis
MIDVSVCLICYNQEKFIAEAIDSVLKQNHTFKMEIVISDDKSTDNTPAIIKAYADKYPDKIKFNPSPVNLGMLRNWERALKLCKGRYIALLEGDDFWNDPDKLQKQFKILEEDPGFAMSCTNAIMKHDSGEPDKVYVLKTGPRFTRADMMEYNFIPTCSILMRNYISDTFFKPPYFKSPFADWIVNFLVAGHGDIHFLNEFSCTYRIHDMGVWGGLKEEKQLKNWIKGLQQLGELIDTKELSEMNRAARKDIGGRLCLHYRKNGQLFKYLNQRFKLFFY